ncbi:MAG: rod shape-determining protein MreD [Marinilabiliales bacterium]|nr:rod shape-determining protein MreD [Marinilabiliales bacterium]
MVNNLLKYSLVFIVAVLLQVLVLNRILILNMISPFFYIIFLLLLPFDTPRALLTFLGFLLGLSVDAFTNTLGVHASVCVLIGFLRPVILNNISTRETRESVSAPRISTMSLNWFIGYTAIFVAIHHLLLFMLEAFTFQGILFTLLRAVFSGVLSIVLIVISQFMIFRK